VEFLLGEMSNTAKSLNTKLSIVYLPMVQLTTSSIHAASVGSKLGH
jgi:hypothetical protein